MFISTNSLRVRKITVKICLLILLFSFLNVSFARALQTVQSSSKGGTFYGQLLEIRSDIQKINDQISTIKSAINLLSEQPVITTEQTQLLSYLQKNKGYLDDLESKIAHDEVEISNDQLSLQQQYFQIFYSSLTIVAVLGGIAFAGIIIVLQWYLKQIFEKQKKDMNDHMTLRLKHTSDLILGESFASLAMPWWKQYEDEYLRFKMDPSRDIAHWIGYVEIAKKLVEKGLDAIQNLGDQVYSIDDGRGLRVYAKLANHWVYHKTVELDCIPGLRTYSEISRIIERANECLALSDNPAVLNLWYDLKQTFSFAMFTFGDDQSKEVARKIIIDLLNGIKPGPKFDRVPDTWRENIFNECFPLRINQQRGDQFAIGINNIRNPPTT